MTLKSILPFSFRAVTAPTLAAALALSLLGVIVPTQTAVAADRNDCIDAIPMAATTSADFGQFDQCVGDLDPTTFTTSSWTEFQTLISVIRLVRDSPETSDYRVTNYNSMIALLRLVLRADPQQLAALVAMLPSGSATDLYEPGDAWDDYSEALEAAEAILSDGSNVGQGQADAALMVLGAKFAELTPIVDPAPARGVLTSVIASIGNLVESDYSAPGWQAIQTALAAARSVVGTDTATASELEAATSTLVAAIAAAESAPPPTAGPRSVLNRLLALSGELDEDSFVPADWAAIEVAIAAAQRTANDGDSSAAELEAALGNLTDAIAKAKRVPLEVPGQTVTVPGQTVTVPGPTITVPGPTVTIRAEDVTPPQSPPGTALAPRIKSAQSSVVVVRGKSITIPAAAYAEAGTAPKVTFTSSKKAIATVSKAGKITAKAAGRTTITVNAASAKAVKISVKVVSANSPRTKVAKVSASGIPKTLAVGKAAWAAGKYTPSSAVNAKVTYQSSRAAVASIDKTGRIVAKAPGKTVITVKAGGKAKRYALTVA
jgi:hypothetical protein